MQFLLTHLFPVKYSQTSVSIQLLYLEKHVPDKNPKADSFSVVSWITGFPAPGKFSFHFTQPHMAMDEKPSLEAEIQLNILG